MRCSAGGTGFAFHSESSQPEPVAGADPLTHFLSSAPAPCQGEPLLEEKKGKQERARNRRLKRGKEKKLLKVWGPERGGKAWNFLAVRGLEKQPTHPGSELLNSPSKLPATAATQTSASTLPCAQICMTARELSCYFCYNVFPTAVTSLRWKFFWWGVTADSTDCSMLNEERVSMEWHRQWSPAQIQTRPDWG